VTRLVDNGKAVDEVYLDFSKAFDTVSTASSWTNWLLTAWMVYSSLGKNWLDGQVQRVVVNGGRERTWERWLTAG